MSHMKSADHRVALSLRLPKRVVDEVVGYATEHGVSKTDAFLHFVQRGIEQEAQGEAVTLDSLASQIDRVLSLLQAQGAHAGHQASSEDCSRCAESVEVHRAQEFATARRAVADVAADYQAVDKAYLFGSFARGDFSEASDIDVRLVLDRSHPFTLGDLSRFSKRVEQATGREVDVVTATHLKNEALAAAIDREKVLVYEREAGRPFEGLGDI